MKEEEKKQKKKYRGLRIFGKILLGLIIFIILLLLFIRSPWGQDIIKDKLISYVTNKTNTTIEVDRLFITFSGNIYLDGLYMEDKNGDTLVYSRELEADVPLMPIIRGKGIAINSLEWNGVRANIIRKDTLQGFNFEFLADAFASPDTTATAQDSTGTTQDFSIGDIDLSNFNVVYNDDVLGIESQYLVDELSLEMEEVDFENMKFHASEGFIYNSKVIYKQIPYEEDPNADPPPMPVLQIDDLELEQVFVRYESVPTGMLAKLNLNELQLELPLANFEENVFDINSLILNNSEVLIKTSTSNEDNNAIAESETSSKTFQWPELRLALDEISLSNNDFTLINNNKKINTSSFDSDAVQVRSINLEANNILLGDEEATANIETLNLIETSGINLKKLQFEAKLDGTDFILHDLALNLNENTVHGNVAASYSSLANFISKPENSVVDVNLQQFNLSIKDIFLVQPELRKNQYLAELSKKRLKGQISAEGTLANLRLPVINAEWGGKTSVVASGQIWNLTQPEKLRYNFPRVKVVSTRNDIRRFIDEEQLGVNLPQDVILIANIEGNTEDIDATADLQTSEGRIALDGNFSGGEYISFNADVIVTDLKLGKIMNNEQFGNLNVNLTASGEGATINELDATLKANVESFDFNDYPIRDLAITGKIENGEGMVTADYKDDNINLDMESFVVLDSIAPQINTDLNVDGANLQALGLTARDIRVAFELGASFKGNTENFDLNAEIVDGVAVYDNETYLLGDFDVSARVRPDTTAMDIRNQVIDMNLRSNADPASFADALQRHYQSYFSEASLSDTITDPVNLTLYAEIRDQPILQEVFVTGLEEMDTIAIAVGFNERKRSLGADIDLPYVVYKGIVVDSLTLQMDSDRNDFSFSTGFQRLEAGPLDIRKTSVVGALEDNKMHVDLNSFFREEHLMHIQTEIARREDELLIQLDPSEVILNGKIWQIPENNEIILGNGSIAFNNFNLTREAQLVSFTDNVAGKNGEYVDIQFENFTLQSLLGFLNPEEKLASGRLNGNFTIEEPYGNTGLDATLDIIDFNVMEVRMGNLNLNAQPVGGNDYAFDMAIKEGKVDLNLTGGFYASEDGARWETELDLNKVEMEIVEAFSQGEIINTSGSFSGNLDLEGTIAAPQYEGNINFNNATFTVASLNAPFTFPDENIRLNNETVLFDDFDIQDENNNILTLNGKVGTESYLNPTFDLAFEADNFMLLNSTAEDNELYYGTAIVDVNGTMTGNLNLPKLQMDLEVSKKSELTYVIPPSEIGIEKREGVVVFVNKENPDAILTEGDEETFTLTGFVINSVISINEGAVVNVIVNEETGDNLRVVGGGDLNFNIYENGRTTLTGRYEMSGGHYEMSLYNLVNRRFEIVKGSSITWAGDPLDANLDVQARYKVETSASSLMAAQTSGADTPVRNQFRQELPFFVYLNVDGELMEPVLTFSLDMPEDEQGAIGGAVYGRIQQLNQQEQELNKQVFSLLVLNRFYPEGTTDGSGGGTMAIARDNLNDALSDQLNLLGNNLLGDSGIELDFGLNSFTDYQGSSPQERTQLDIAASKSFMDERLIVQVGSEVDIQGSNTDPEEESPLIGNVSIEYLLTENGRFRIRGFRRNTFENVIDGQVIASGLALIFTREFNKFRELWGNLKEEEEIKKPQ